MPVSFRKQKTAHCLPVLSVVMPLWCFIISFHCFEDRISSTRKPNVMQYKCLAISKWNKIRTGRKKSCKKQMLPQCRKKPWIFVNKDECKQKNVWHMDDTVAGEKKLIIKRENVYRKLFNGKPQWISSNLKNFQCNFALTKSYSHMVEYKGFRRAFGWQHLNIQVN